MSLIQSILFNKEHFSLTQSFEWLIKHNYKFNDVDITKEKYFHFRQRDPKQMKEEGYFFRSKMLGPYIVLVIGYK